MSLKFTKSTDTEHEVKLDSFLISATWQVGRAIAGNSAPFEVRTAFVGEGAKIEVKGKSDKGLDLGKISSVIRNNRFQGDFAIPQDAELGDKVYFEVKLSKNSLNDTSERIPVFLPMQVFNLKWSAKEARRGDILTLTADVNGLRDGEEVTLIIYEYDRDGVHDKIVELPGTVKDKKIEVKWEYEYYEDTDEIQSQEELQQYGGSYNPPEYFFTVKIENTEYGIKQESRLLQFKDYVEIALIDNAGAGLADQKFTIHLADGSTQDGQLDQNGRARIDDISPGPYRIEFPDAPGFSRKQGPSQ
ncbi:MAG: hypothetical protein ABIE70_02360 [bacterium]